MFLLLLMLACWAPLQAVAGENRAITISLRPRNYTPPVDPRDDPNFHCGLDKAVDPQRLLAEMNSAFLLTMEMLKTGCSRGEEKERERQIDFLRQKTLAVELLIKKDVFQEKRRRWRWRGVDGELI